MDKFVTVEVETIGKEKIEKVCITKKNKYSLEEENYIPKRNKHEANDKVVWRKNQRDS